MNTCSCVLYFLFCKCCRGGKEPEKGEESLRKWVSRLQWELAPLAPAPAQSKSCRLGGGDVGERVCLEVGRTPEREKTIFLGFV